MVTLKQAIHERGIHSRWQAAAEYNEVSGSKILHELLQHVLLPGLYPGSWKT